MLDNIKVCHFGQFTHRETGSFTIATRVSMYDDNKVVVEYGVAFCSPKDFFVKKTGNKLATERLVKSSETGVFDYTGIAVAHQAKHIDVVLAVLSGMVSMNIAPDWARPVVINELIRFGCKSS